MRVSVIIRAYNAEATITRAIESVLSQTLPKNLYSILILDDGSTDQTVKIAEGFLVHENMSIVRQANQGAVAAANNGFKLAQGEYVALLDSDDRWEPNFLMETIARLDADPQLDFVYTDYFEDWKGERRRMYIDDVFQTIADNSMYRLASLASAGYWADGVFFAEYDLLLRTRSTWKLAHVDKPLVTYYRRGESLTGNPERVEAGLEQLLERHPDKREEIARIRSYALL